MYPLVSFAYLRTPLDFGLLAPHGLYSGLLGLHGLDSGLCSARNIYEATEHPRVIVVVVVVVVVVVELS